MKDTLLEILGTFGVIIYFVITIILNLAWTVFPFYLMYKYFM